MISRFFSDPTNTPFLVSLAILVTLSLIVAVGSILGFIGDLNIDFDADAASPGEHALDFLGASAIPSSIFVVVSATSFFLAGFIIQSIAYAQTNNFVNGWIAIIPAALVTIFILNATGRTFKKYKVKVDSSAVHGDSFVGKSAVITEGNAKKGLPSQAKLTDQFGQTHYLLVEPVTENDEYPAGTEVIILQRNGSKYIGVSASSENLKSLDLEEISKSLNQKQ